MTSPAQVSVDMEIPRATSLAFAGLEWRAAVSTPFVGRLEVTSTSPSLNLQGLLGTPVTLTVTGSRRRRQDFTGEVDEVEQRDTSEGRTSYLLTVRPTLWRLAAERRSQVFADLSAVDVLLRLLDEHGVHRNQLRYEGDPETLAQVVQHDQSDLSFVEELLADAGFHYRFDHSGEGDTLVVDDAVDVPRRQLAYVGGTLGATGVTSWTVRASRDLAGLSAHARVNVPGVEVGRAFALEGHPRSDQNQGHVPVWATYRIVSDPTARPGRSGVPAAFDVELEARPYGEPVGPAAPPPDVVGRRGRTLETALVTGPVGERIHVDELGRVRVRPSWEPPGGVSLLAPVAQPAAGDGRGTTFWPRIGDRVWVEFEEGDPSRPVVVGSAYGDDRMPPVELPAGRDETALVSESSSIVLEDRVGEERLSISAAGDQLSAVGGTHSTSVGGDDLTSVGGRLTSVVGGDRSSDTGGDVVEAVGGDLTLSVEGDRRVSVRGDSTDAVDGRASTAVGGDRVGTVGGDDELSVDGELVIEARQRLVLRCGDASITLRPDGDIDVEGAELALVAAGDLVLKATRILD